MMNMNEENIKLAKIKRSSRIGKRVSIILAAVTGVFCIVMLITGIVFLAGNASLEDQIAKTAQSVVTEPKDKIGYVSAVNIELPDPTKIETSSPALREALDARPYSVSYGFYLTTLGVALLFATIVLIILSRGFAMIENADNPFTPGVIRRVTIVMIVLSIVLAFTKGIAYAAVGLIATWMIRSILDYGQTLQIQSDETL